MNQSKVSNLKCAQHDKEITFFCTSDNKPLCLQCKQQHKPLNHNIMDKKGAETLISQSIPSLLSNFKQNLEELSKLNLPKLERDISKDSEIIDKAHENLINVINSYFKEVRENYENLFAKYPSNQSKELIQNRLDKYINEITNLDEKSKLDGLTFSEVFNFFDSNYNKSDAEISQQIKGLSQVQPNENEIVLPKIIVNETGLQNIFLDLGKYITTTLPDIQTVNNKNNTGKKESNLLMNIKMNNYFKQSEEKVMAIINEQTKSISLTHLEMNKTMILPLEHKEDIPYGHSLIITPDSSIFINGGIFMNSGLICNSHYKFVPQTINLEKKQNMNVKRIGHCLVYLEDLELSNFFTFY